MRGASFLLPKVLPEKYAPVSAAHTINNSNKISHDPSGWVRNQLSANQPVVTDTIAVVREMNR